jgi:quinol monooxygenase YgiN
MIVLIFKARVNREDNEELTQTLKSMCHKIGQLPGCCRCECHRSIREQNVISFSVQWASQEHFAEQANSELFNALNGAFQVLATEYSADIMATEFTADSGSVIVG